MTANFVGLTAVCASVLAFIATWKLVRKLSPVRRLCLLGGFTLLSVPALLFAIYYAHVLPEAAWFYGLRSWRGSEFFSVFPGCAGGCAASFLPNLLMGFPLFAVIAIAALPYLKPLLSPLPDEAFHDRWRGGACLQSTLSTCGPASVCTILKFLGSDVSERQVARAAFSSTGGTEAWYLARYVRDRGYVPKFTFDDSFASDTTLPAVVGVRIGGMGHFIAVLGIERDTVLFADPLEGFERLPLDEFRRRYSFTGFHLSIRKG
jgi:hypothetical protein